ncbi:MAG: 50S ribosomal protein L1 [Nitrospinota bacterium]|nr:50S ribosomal protein L1 [Nitrospinota bacterium]
MAKLTKNQKAVADKVKVGVKYTLEDALKLAKETKMAKFNESVDMAIRLGVDPTKADQMVRGSVVLPGGTGKNQRILVFAKGDKEIEAKEAKADFVGGDDLVEKIKGGWMEFDVAVATPDMMGTVGKIGKLLGPRGLMPNPKSGTVTVDIKKAISEIKAGRVEFRVDKGGVVHASIGKSSFEHKTLLENASAFLEAIQRLKPSSAKGIYLRSISVSTTMGPGIKVDESAVASSLN